MAKFKKRELEAHSLTTLMCLCLQVGLSNEGDKDTLIARLLGKPEPEPAEPTEPEAPKEPTE